MFERRTLPGDLATVRERHAPDSLVLDVDRDFETLPPAVAEDLGLLVDALDPARYPAEWVPADAPTLLTRYAGSDFTVGLPGDGTVTWTRQTDPPTVLVKKRAKTTPDAFTAFLVAEALVQVGLDVPESFLPFFGSTYPALADVLPLDGAGVYQMAAALYDGWVGLQTRPVFAGWSEGGHGGRGEDENGTPDGVDDDHHPLPHLHDAWVDAGERLDGRVSGLPGAVARGETSFPEATELACAAIKHGLDLPAPFSALDTKAYVDHGPDYAVQWAEKTFAELDG